MDLALLQQQQQHQQQQQLHHKHFNQSQFLNQLQANTNNNSFSGNETHNGHYKQMSQPAMISQPNQLTQTQLPQQQQHQSFHRPSRSVLHVRENSIDELDALFDPSKWANRKTNNVPLAKRNLPQSFFKPPETGGTKTPKLINSNNHSRQNSIDQANMINHSQLLNQQHLILQQKLNTLNSSTQQPNHLSSNFHTRSVSEPVAAALSPFNLNQPQTQFTQQNSLLFKNQSNQQSIQNQSLPYGWRAAKTQTGQRFYVNYITKQTSWTVPHQAQEATNSSYFDQQNNQLENFISSSSSASSSPVLNLNNLNNPAEADLNMNNGHINSHLNIEIKNDCILNANPNSLGLSTASTVSSSASVSASDDDLISDFHQNQQFELQTQLEKLENEQQLEFLLNQIPMPNGWEKAQTAKGEVYFINHNNKSTYWEDPRISLIPNFLKQQKLKNAQGLMRQNPHVSDQQAANNQQLINSSQQVNNSSISPMFINNTVSSNLCYNGSNLASNTSTSITNGIITASSNLINGETIQTVNDSNFDMVHQTNHGDIKSLIVEVINKKKELFKSLEDLNKQETFLRAQLNAAYSNSGLPVGSNPSNEFNMNFEENFEIGINLELGANVSAGKNITNSVENMQGINTNIGQESNYPNNIELEKINTIQSNKSSSSSSSPSSILSSSSTNSNNMTYYLKNDNLDSSNNMNTFPANSNTLHMTADQKNAKKMQNGENLLSIIKTESTNPQLVDLDTVSCLYNKLLINNNQNSQFQIDQQNIPHSLINSLPNKIPDFI